MIIILGIDLLYLVYVNSIIIIDCFYISVVKCRTCCSYGKYWQENCSR